MGTAGLKDELPVDRGWSWVICFASFICMLLLGTAPQVLSVLFLELVTEFESSITVTSLSIMLYIMSISVSSLLSTSLLVPRFGERLVIAVASISFSACSVGYSQSPNIGVFIAFATMQGISVGMIYVPAISLISYYFNKRRSLATTISNCGVCVAAIVAPPFTRFLASEFGMRGAFLIMAAIELHMAAAALLLRPVSCYRKITREATGLTEVDDSEAPATKDNAHQNNTELSDFQNHKTNHNDLSEVEQKLLSSSEKAGHHLNSDVYATSPTHMSTSLKENGRFYDRMDSRVSEIIIEGPETPSFSEKEGPFASTKPVLRHQTSKAESYRRQHSHPSHYGSDWSMGHPRPTRAAHYGSLLSVTSGTEPAAVGMTMQRVEEQVDEEGKRKEEGGSCRSCCFVRVVMRVFDPSLLNQWAFRVFLLAAVPSATTQFLLQYLPTISVVKGATKDQAATLLTIVGSVDLVSRLALGVFADTHILRPTQICTIAQICLGILCQFNPLFTNFDTMLVMAVIMGLFIGTRQSLMPMMQIEIVGIERMSRCLSLTAMVATISAASHSPLLSAVMEATGSYNVVLHYVGAALMVGGILIGSTSIVGRLIDERREQS